MSVLGRRLALVSRDLLGMSSVCACRGGNTITSAIIWPFSRKHIAVYFVFFREKHFNLIRSWPAGGIEAARQLWHWANVFTQGDLTKTKICEIRILCQVFGYRGVILFPWLARVYDRDMPSKPPNTRSLSESEPVFFFNMWISGKGFWTQTVLISPPPPGICKPPPSFVSY